MGESCVAYIDLLTDQMNSVHYNLVRESSNKDNILVGLKKMTKALQMTEYGKLIYKMLMKRKMLTTAGCFLESFAAEVIETHNTRSVALTEACLEFLACFSTFMESGKMTEKRWGKIILTTLRLLGFASAFDSERFKHSFPMDTLKYLKTTQGKKFQAKMKKLDPSERAKFKKLLRDEKPDFDKIDVSPKYAIDLKVNCSPKTFLSDVVESGNLGCKLPLRSGADDIIQEFVRIVYWSAPNFCWVQCVNDRTNEVLQNLKDVDCSHVTPIVEQPQRGDTVLVRSQANCLRGKVLNCCDGTASVFAFDFGFVRDFDLATLHRLPRSLAEEPPIGGSCYFAISPPVPSPRILILGTKLLYTISEANPRLASDAIIKTRSHPALLHLLDCKFETTNTVLKILVKLSKNEDGGFVHSLGDLNGNSLIFQIFRAVHRKWMENKSDEHESSLIMCCHMIELLAKHTELKNTMKELSSLLVLECLPPECKSEVTRLLSSMLKVPKTTKGASDLEYKQGQFLEKHKSGAHMVNEGRNLNSIDERNLEETVCALANHPDGGRIAFGVSNSGHIIGIHFDQKDRDKFRLMVDELSTQRIKPLIPPGRVRVHFGKVDGAQNDLFLVHVDITGMPLGIHSTWDGRYMVCFPHGILREMSSNDLKDMVADREERKYLQEIEMLKATIEKLIK